MRQLHEQSVGEQREESKFEELGEKVLRQQRERFREMQQFFEQQQRKTQGDYLQEQKQQQQQQQRSEVTNSTASLPARFTTLSPTISIEKSRSPTSSSEATLEWARSKLPSAIEETQFAMSPPQTTKRF